MVTLLTIKLLKALLSMLNPATMKELVGIILDFVETKVLGTSISIDDRIILPIIQRLRKLINR